MIVAFLLVVVIMVQTQKVADFHRHLAVAVAHDWWVQKTSDFLDKSTWTLATIMLALILFSNVFIMEAIQYNQKLLTKRSACGSNHRNSCTSFNRYYQLIFRYKIFLKCQLLTSWHFCFVMCQLWAVAQFLPISNQTFKLKFNN